jgi:hypothetical protein
MLLFVPPQQSTADLIPFLLLGIGREHFINPVKWRVYVPPFEIFGDDCILNEKDYCYDYP